MRTLSLLRFLLYCWKTNLFFSKSCFSLMHGPSYSNLLLLTHCRCVRLLLNLITVNHTHTHTHTFTHQNFSGRGIGPSQRPLPDSTHQPQETNTHAPFGIRTRNPSKRAAAAPRIRPRGHQDRPVYNLHFNTFAASYLNTQGLIIHT